MKSLVVILVGIGLLLLSGCAGSTPSAPTPSQFAGAEPPAPPAGPTPVPLPTPEPAVATITSAEELIGLLTDHDVEMPVPQFALDDAAGVVDLLESVYLRRPP